MNKLSQKILEKIEKDKVRPKSRSYFILMHTLLGLALGGLVIISSIGVAIVIRNCTLTNWELLSDFKNDRFKNTLFILPYLWVMFIALVILIADKLFTHTKKGHRLKPWIVVTASISISIVLGTLLFFVKIDRPIENVLRNHFGPYSHWETYKHQVFVSPEQGVLAGQIIMLNNNKEWMILDFKGNEWTVDLERATFRNPFEPEIGVTVGMTGEKIDDHYFEAQNVELWKKVLILPPPPITTDFMRPHLQ